MNEQMQKDFETWADQCGYTLKMIDQQDGLGTAIYANGQTRSAWNAWRAARESMVIERHNAELVNILTKERDFLLTKLGENESQKAQIAELTSQLVAVKEGGGTGQSPCAKFCESVALGKDYRLLRADRDKLQDELIDMMNQRDGLAAQIEVLRKDNITLLGYVADSERWFNLHDPNGYISPKRESAKACLAQVRADTGRAGFVAGAESMKLAFQYGGNYSTTDKANQYAERVKAGEA